MTAPADSARRLGRSGARWGLLLIALATCVALIIGAVSSYDGARRTASAVTRDATTRMAHELRRELIRSREDPQRALDEVHDDLRARGLRFAGAMRRGGQMVASIGEPTGSIRPPARRPRGEVSLVPLDRDDRVRVFVPLGPGRRRPQSPWSRRPLGLVGPGGLLVLEVEPVLAQKIMGRAVLSLAVNLVAAGILILGAVVFWRLSLRADRYQDQLTRDEQLKLLGQMSAVLGHELKNPLASLKGHAQLLLERLPADHADRTGAETVVREATRLEMLTGQILDFAKTGQVDPEPADPAALAHVAVEHAGADPVTVRVGSGLTEWPLDRIRMERVLCNLLTNARHASTGGEAIELSIGVSGERLVIEVGDRGTGLPAGEEDAIFEPFHTTRVKGTGLGLALARRVVEGHGGRITAANRPGGGAAFRIELPRGPSPAPRPLST